MVSGIATPLFPVISINLAISADGKISSVSRRPSGWTSDADHQRLKSLRNDADALLVGRGTLDADRMTLTAPTNPWRCVVSRSGRFDPAHPLFHTPGGPIHLLGTENHPSRIPGTILHSGDLSTFLQSLASSGIRHVHCEGGGELIRELAALDLIGIIHLTWAGHTLFGGQAAPTLTGIPGDFLPASREFELIDFQPLEAEGECFLSYRRTGR